MWHPFKKKSSNYTDAIVDADVQAASNPATNKLVAAQRGCMNVYGDKLAQCTYTGPQQITKKHLLDIGRDIPRYGHSRLVIIPDGGSYKLVRPIRADKVSGAGWQVTLREGFKDRTLKLLDAEVINFVFNPSEQYPWRGVPLWESATARLATELDLVMGDEAAGPAGKFIWINFPHGDVDARKKARKQMAESFRFTSDKFRGKFTALLNQAPLADRTQSNEVVRIGPDWPTSLEQTRKQLAREICVACNVAPEMLFGGAAGTVRESNRQFVSVMQSVCDVLADVLTNSLNQQVTLNADVIFKADLIARSRAFGSLVTGGLDKDQALAICGLKDD